MNNYSYVSCPYCHKLTTCNSDVEYCASIDHLYSHFPSKGAFDQLVVMEYKDFKNKISISFGYPFIPNSDKKWQLWLKWNQQMWIGKIMLEGTQFELEGEIEGTINDVVINLIKEARAKYEKWKMWL